MLLHADTGKSPIQYPGGKAKAARYIRRLIPAGVATLCAPFIGGAHVELYAAADGMTVYGSDIFKPVVDFWQEALHNAPALAEAAWRHYPMNKALFKRLQQTCTELPSRQERAAAFFALNLSSFSSTTLSGGMSSHLRDFNPRRIKRLAEFSNRNLQVEHADYRDALAKRSSEFLYCDPPYLIESSVLYGRNGSTHRGFDHAELADTLRQRSGWILSYNDCAEIRRLYAGYRMLQPQWKYSMSGGKPSSELLIMDC